MAKNPGWSSNNTITNNKIYYPTTPNKSNYLQGIYMSCYTQSNIISKNTIINPPSAGIGFNHGYSHNNIIAYNIIHHFSEYADGIYVNCESTDINPANGPVSSVYGNHIYNNYIYYIEYTIPRLGGILPDKIVTKGIYFTDDELEENNYAYNNFLTQELHPNDPYWSSYTAGSITDRVIVGNFDGDLFGQDDIAAFYDYGNAETRLHIFKKYWFGNFFYYPSSSGWWSAENGYHANKITGRVVAGNFDGDAGRKDDIAAFYDYGNGETHIHVFTSTGSSFDYSGSTGWCPAISSGYDADKITGRVVAGYFNNDYKKDIAVFYDYEGSTRIHVFTSTGNSFTYSGSAGWWSSMEYTAEKITNKVVSGDFNCDGKTDIAAFYDIGNNQTRIDVFTCTGSKFNYKSCGVWNVATGRIKGVVSGDFTKDFRDDVAVFCDYGFSRTKIYVFASTGTSLNTVPVARWDEAGYDADLIAGRLVAGNFNFDGNPLGQDDIAAFYDYSDLCGNVRTHVWQVADNNEFSLINGSLGFPWMSGFIHNNNANKLAHVDTTSNDTIIYGNNMPKVPVAVSIYPNPNQGNFIMEVTGDIDERFSFEIYNIMGDAILKEEEIADRRFIIDISSKPAGIYIVKTFIDDRIFVEKIIYQ